jgi:hypothetical protein
VSVINVVYGGQHAMFHPIGWYSPTEGWDPTKMTKAPTEAHAPFGAFAHVGQ